MSNALEQLIADTLTEGMSRGRAEGRVEGITTGQQETVRKAILRRFGELPPALERRIAAADAATLDRLLDRVYAATRLDDLLEDA